MREENRILRELLKTKAKAKAKKFLLEIDPSPPPDPEDDPDGAPPQIRKSSGRCVWENMEEFASCV